MSWIVMLNSMIASILLVAATVWIGGEGHYGLFGIVIYFLVLNNRRQNSQCGCIQKLKKVFKKTGKCLMCGEKYP